MFYKIYKYFSLIFISLIALTMAGIFVFQQFIPDKFFSEKESLSLPGIYGKVFTAESVLEKAAPVMSTESDSYKAKIKFLGAVSVKDVDVQLTEEKSVTVCGTPFGVKMFMDGVLVVGFSEIDSESGKCCPAVESGIEKGDLIKSINGKEVFRNSDVAKLVEESGGKAIDITVLRDRKELSFSIVPKFVFDENKYKVGFWVRDSSAGIGTLTFYDPKTMFFGGLGHAVCDVDTGGIIPFLSGEVVPAAITKIRKSVVGSPGELSGSFIGEDIGIVKTNDETGLYGTLEDEVSGFSAVIGHKQDVYLGPAVIYSTIDGTKAIEYDVEIEQINLSENSETKNMIIRVTDKELIELTGGIVQGMSGSPILQDGKLIGAITHVFVNDPTKGYGIFIENMLDAAG